jgi:hypothetical protein
MHYLVALVAAPPLSSKDCVYVMLSLRVVARLAAPLCLEELVELYTTVDDVLPPSAVALSEGRLMLVTERHAQ